VSVYYVDAEEENGLTLLLESTPTERAAQVAYWLANGKRLTTADVAESLQISQRTAQRLFTAVSRVLPVYRDEGGYWMVAEETTVRISIY
jgi:predicted DNA-binding transcriptional regulator YafY